MTDGIFRTPNEVAAAATFFFDLVWYHAYQDARPDQPPSPERDRDDAAAAELEERYGMSLQQSDSLAMLNVGRLSALRWVLGEPWDMANDA